MLLWRGTKDKKVLYASDSAASYVAHRIILRNNIINEWDNERYL